MEKFPIEEQKKLLASYEAELQKVELQKSCLTFIADLLRKQIEDSENSQIAENYGRND